jgi:hypothetical protein
MTENFHGEVFSTECLTQRDENVVALALCDKQYDGKFKVGSRVHIPGVGRPTTYDLPKSGLFVDSEGNKIAAEGIEDEGTDFYIDQRKFVHFHTNDLDTLLNNQDVAHRFMGNYANEMATLQDIFIYNIIKAQHGLTSTGTGMIAKTAYGMFCDALAVFYATHSSIKPADLTIEAHPYIVNVLSKALQYHGTPNDLSGGNTGITVNGVKVLQSNNTIITTSGGVVTTAPKPADTEFHTDIFHSVIRTKRAVAFAEPQEMSWSTYDLNGDGVGKGVKGWYYYGGKVIYPDEVLDLSLTLGTEVDI